MLGLYAKVVDMNVTLLNTSLIQWLKISCMVTLVTFSEYFSEYHFFFMFYKVCNFLKMLIRHFSLLNIITGGPSEGF